jgi:hypothetical protein
MVPAQAFTLEHILGMITLICGATLFIFGLACAVAPTQFNHSQQARVAKRGLSSDTFPSAPFHWFVLGVLLIVCGAVVLWASVILFTVSIAIDVG